VARGRLKILVGVDFSSESLRALRAARELAAKSGGRVTIAHVRPISNARAAMMEERGDLLRENPKRLSAAMAQHYARRLRELRLGPEEKTLLLRGGAGWELCREARGRYDLLVLGRRGRDRVASFLLGSTVQAILARSTIPVLVVSR
jgi:nucleotide-binding universal stress UspA family protein